MSRKCKLLFNASCRIHIESKFLLAITFYKKINQNHIDTTQVFVIQVTAL